MKGTNPFDTAEIAALEEARKQTALTPEQMQMMAAKAKEREQQPEVITAHKGAGLAPEQIQQAGEQEQALLINARRALQRPDFVKRARAITPGWENLTDEEKMAAMLSDNELYQHISRGGF